MYRLIMRAAVAAVFALSLQVQAATPAPTLSEARRVQLEAQQSARVEKGRSQLLAKRSELGLGAQAGFVSRDAFTNPQGRAVARFTQTHQGFRVWGGEAIVHVEADGQVRTLTQGVQAGLTLEGSPRLSAEQALAIATKDLGAQGPMRMEPQVERVVFPSRLTGGLVSRFDPTKKREVMDQELSTWAHPPAAPYVWAYEVKTVLHNRQDGMKEYAYIVDGNTGAILRKWNELQAAAATGTGNSLYSGSSVSLATTQSEVDGTYALMASDRGTLANRFLSQRYGMTQPGLRTMYLSFQGPWLDAAYAMYEGNAADTWGDGQQFASFELCFYANYTLAYLCGAPELNGQTAGVDSHHGLVTSWDFYKNVFGRNGIDNAGTSTFVSTHEMSMDWFGNVHRLNNAFWSSSVFGLILGDGSYPHDEAGFRSLTEMDIAGHELTHGVTAATANLLYRGESGGLNEAFSDIFGEMIAAYARRPAGSDASIPDFDAADLGAWEVGKGAGGGKPLRWMYKPSLDQLSPDVWFDGLEVLDVHHSSGPLNRAFYFLAQGASATPGSDTYSDTLPQGMVGIGNDRATRIFYKVLSEHLTSSATYLDARNAAVAAATELYGADSAEALAVAKAFVGIHIGSLPGEPLRPVVRFPVVHPEGTTIGGNNTYPPGILGKVQIFPTRVPVVVKATVENTDNKAVTFSLGAPQDGWHGGVINADGTWTTPMWPYGNEFLTLIATSQADPRMFAKGRMFAVELDADRDTETDALDLAAIAMAYGVQAVPHLSMQVAGNGTVGEWDLVYFNEGLTNAWPVK